MKAFITGREKTVVFEPQLVPRRARERESCRPVFKEALTLKSAIYSQNEVRVGGETWIFNIN